MLIDWFTIVAQALNFLILIWLMKRFLYKPILEAVDAREKEIANQTNQAAVLKTEADKSLEEFQIKNQQLQNSAAALLNTATNEAALTRTRLIEEAQKEAENLKISSRKAFDKEKEDLSHSIGTQIQKEIFLLSTKMLKDIASASLEDQIVHVFTERIRLSEPKPKGLITAALNSEIKPVIVRSAFALSPSQKNLVESAFEKLSEVKITFQYELTLELICGIECITGDFKLSWSIAEYLSVLEKNVANVQLAEVEG